MDKKNIFIAFALFLAVAFLAWAVLHVSEKNEGRQDAGQPAKIKVSASFYPLYYFAAAIGGERADVSSITPSGAEPHDYEPSPADLAAIENSRILAINGDGLEPWSDDLVRNLSRDTIVVVAGEGSFTRSFSEEGKNISDPHVWLSPVLAQAMADKIEASFEQADPQNAEYYRQNANKLKDDLKELDDDFKSGLKDCKRRSFITSHAAFGYLAGAYGLEQVPIAGLSPDSEPSPKELADIAGFARENGVKYIFFESLASPKLSRTLAGEVGAQTLVLNPLEGLSGEEIAQGKNYLTEMRSNLSNLRTALECE